MSFENNNEINNNYSHTSFDVNVKKYLNHKMKIILKKIMRKKTVSVTCPKTDYNIKKEIPLTHALFES